MKLRKRLKMLFSLASSLVFLYFLSGYSYCLKIRMISNNLYYIPFR